MFGSSFSYKLTSVFLRLLFHVLSLASCCGWGYHHWYFRWALPCSREQPVVSVWMVELLQHIKPVILQCLELQKPWVLHFAGIAQGEACYITITFTSCTSGGSVSKIPTQTVRTFISLPYPLGFSSTTTTNSLAIIQDSPVVRNATRDAVKNCVGPLSHISMPTFLGKGALISAELKQSKLVRL